MSARDRILAEIEKLPEPVLLEALHYIQYIARQREDEEWADVLPGREIEQEVLDIIDRP